jgi:hypothetical protein
VVHDLLSEEVIAPPDEVPDHFQGHPLQDEPLGAPVPPSRRPSLPHSFLQRKYVLDPLDRLVGSTEPSKAPYFGPQAIPYKQLFASHHRQISPLDRLTLQERNVLQCKKPKDRMETFLAKQNSQLHRLNASVQHLSVLCQSLSCVVQSCHQDDLPENFSLLWKAIKEQVTPMEVMVSTALANNVLLERDLVLESAECNSQAKARLRQLPLFSSRLFPTDLQKVLEETSPSLSERTLGSLEKLVAKLPRQGQKPQQQQQQQRQQPSQSRGTAQPKPKVSARQPRGRGRGRGGASATATATATKPSTKQDFQKGQQGPSKF